MVWWWIGNALVLLVVVPLVVYLAHRVIILALEAQRYAEDILEHGVLLAGNLDPLPALAETRDLVEQVGGSAARYVGALHRVA